jgi:hypothetical protein
LTEIAKYNPAGPPPITSIFVIVYIPGICRFNTTFGLIMD